MTVPTSPSPFTARTRVLSIGTTIYRVHSNRFEPNEDNPGPSAPTRFAFIGAPPVPVFYTAGDEEAALAESILHDLPKAGGALESKTYRNRSCSRLVVGRELSLASLVSVDDRALGVAAADACSTGADAYPETVRWAEAAHTAGFDGLVYPSTKASAREAHVLFGDRVDRSDLSVDTSYWWSFDDVDGIAKLITLAGQLRVQIRLPF
ncbi:RES family NAD+ phosphorylase [Homoserinimonas sp. A447]